MEDDSKTEGSQIEVIITAFKKAFPYTAPIAAGFFFISAAYGFYMNVMGFSCWYPFIMAMVIFGGSLEFVTVTLLLAPFAPVQALFIALVIQARHLFYGLAMLEKYKGLGWKKPLLIFGMCDETFAINNTVRIPKNVDRGWFYFAVTFLNWSFWAFGALSGGVAGSYISIDTSGLDFVMTAMFVVIFLEQYLNDKQHITGYVGILVSAVCLVLFGKDSFIIPTMVSIVVLLTLFRKPITEAGGYK